MGHSCIIFYQHIVREIDMCRKLERELATQSDKRLETAIFSIDFEWSKAIDYARKHNVIALIMPWMRLKSHESLVAPFLEENPKTAVISLNHEQIGTRFSMPMLLPNSSVAKTQVYHCAWGNFFVDELVRCGVPRNLIRVTGNGRADVFGEPRSSMREMLAKQYGLDNQKRWILFAESRFEGYGAPGSDFREEIVECGVAEAAIDEYASITANSLRVFLSQLNELENAFFEKHEVIYRLHPGQNLDYPIDERISLINELPIGEWLGVVDAYATFGSTSALEAEIAGVPVFICSDESIPEWYRLDCLKDYTQIHSLSEIEQFDLSMIAARQNSTRSYEEYFGVLDGNATRRVAEAIIEIASDENHVRCECVSNAALIRRRYCFEWITLMACKTNLLKAIKFPRSAYRERRDIPYFDNNLEGDAL